jgi:type IV secretion system protein TrbD
MSTGPLEKRPIHPSLIRPILLGGAERGMAIISVAAGIGVPMFTGLHPVASVIAVLFAFSLHALGVWLARRDPQAIAVYVRSISAKDHYLPWGSRRLRAGSVRPSIPGA